MDSQGKPLYDVTCMIFKRWQGFKLWDIKERDNLHLYKIFGKLEERPTYETILAWLYDYELTLFGIDGRTNRGNLFVENEYRIYILKQMKAAKYDFVSIDDNCSYN